MDAWLDLASIYTKLEAWHDSNICLDKARSIDFFYPKYWHVRGKYSQLPDLILLIYSVMLSFYQTNKELKINYCNFLPSVVIGFGCICFSFHVLWTSRKWGCP